MTNDQAEKILKIFRNEGMLIQPGDQYSVKGQIAQLLNGCEKLIDQCAIIGGWEAEKCKSIPDGTRVADAIRNKSPAEKAPFLDFIGAEIFEGDVIKHPSGQTGVVKIDCNKSDESDKWVVDYGDKFLSRLALQVGDKGQGKAIKRNQL